MYPATDHLFIQSELRVYCQVKSSKQYINFFFFLKAKQYIIEMPKISGSIPAYVHILTEWLECQIQD